MKTEFKEQTWGKGLIIHIEKKEGEEIKICITPPCKLPDKSARDASRYGAAILLGTVKDKLFQEISDKNKEQIHRISTNIALGKR